MVPVNGSCHVSLSHVTESCHWVISLSHVTESCQRVMSPSRVTREWLMPDTIKPCQLWMHHVTYECVMSHVDESYLAYERVMFHLEMSHVTHIQYGWAMSVTNASRHLGVCHVTHERVVSRIWKSRVSLMNESCRKHVMSHLDEPCQLRMHHVTHECVMSHMDESYLAYERVAFHLWMSHVTHAMSHLDEPCQIRMHHARYE